MIEAKIRSFALATPEQQGDAMAFRILGFCKFDFPGLNMTISGVTLTWSPERGYCAMPPNAPVKNGDGLAVRWVHNSQMALSMVDYMVAAFKALGGSLPAAHSQNHTNAGRRVARQLRIVPASHEVGDEPDNSGVHRLVGDAA